MLQFVHLVSLLFFQQTHCHNDGVKEGTAQTTTSNSNSLYPRIVWMYYDGALPALLEQILRKTQTILAHNWTVRVLTPKDLPLLLDVNSFPSTFSLYATQMQSDLIRLRLLEKYGGWWIDVSTIINSDVFMNEMLEEVILANASFGGYCYKQCPRQLIENGIFYAQQGSEFVHAWNEEFTRALSFGRENYIYSLYRSGVDLQTQIFYTYPEINPYFASYAAQRAVLARRVPRNISIVTRDSEDVIYKLFQECEWEELCGIAALQTELVMPKYPVTKVWSQWRRKAWPGTEAARKRTMNEPEYTLRTMETDRMRTFSTLMWTALLIAAMRLLLTHVVETYTQTVTQMFTLSEKHKQ